jgi:hypothetical protein
MRAKKTSWDKTAIFLSVWTVLYLITAITTHKRNKPPTNTLLWHPFHLFIGIMFGVSMSKD